MPKNSTKNNPEALAALRIPVSLVVQIAGKESSMLFFAQNLSMTGIYLESDAKIPPDQIKLQDELNLLFYLPKASSSGSSPPAGSGGEMIAATAKVVRRQEIQNARQQAVDGIALEFLKISSSDQERLRLFVADYETELEESVMGDEAADAENTDPHAGFSPLREHEDGPILFEPLTLDHYEELYLQVKVLAEKMAAKEAVELSAMQLLAFEVYEKISPDERRRYKEFIETADPLFKQKIFLNILFLRLKLQVETQQLRSLELSGFAAEKMRGYLTDYASAMDYEIQQMNEVINYLSQKLVAQEDWDHFKWLNRERKELDQTLGSMRLLLQTESAVTSAVLPPSTSLVKRLSVEDCLQELQDMIPDPEEEKDSFINGASGDDIRKLWDKIFGLKDDSLKAPLLRALATRRKVRDTYLKCLQLEDAVVSHQAALTEIFREDAKLIKESIATLAELRKRHPAEHEVIHLLIRLLEALTFAFGKLIRTIPQKLLTTDEIDSMRFRASTFRQKRKSKVAAIAYFSRKYALVTLLVISLLSTLLYHGIQAWKNEERAIPLKFVEDLPVLRSIKDNAGNLRVVVAIEPWINLSAQTQMERIRSLITITKNENIAQFLLLDERGALLGFSLAKSKEGEPFATYLTIPPER